MDQVAGKSVDNTGKTTLKLVKLLCENLQIKVKYIQTSVKFRDFKELYLR